MINTLPPAAYQELAKRLRTAGITVEGDNENNFTVLPKDISEMSKAFDIGQRVRQKYEKMGVVKNKGIWE